MYDSIVKLRFENAGIFRKKYTKDGVLKPGSDDRIFTNVIRTDNEGVRYNIGQRDLRTKNQWIQQRANQLHFSFVSQIIRVLMGLRPISRIRGLV